MAGAAGGELHVGRLIRGRDVVRGRDLRARRPGTGGSGVDTGVYLDARDVHAAPPRLCRSKTAHKTADYADLCEGGVQDAATAAKDSQWSLRARYGRDGQGNARMTAE